MERIKELLQYIFASTPKDSPCFDEASKEITTYLIGEVSRLPRYEHSSEDGDDWIEKDPDGDYLKRDDVINLLGGK